MDEIKDIIPKVLAGISSPNPQESTDIQKAWEQSTSVAERQHSKISGFKNGTIFVNIDSSAWLYQFKMKQNKFLEQLHSEIKDIKKIVFKIGKVT